MLYTVDYRTELCDGQSSRTAFRSQRVEAESADDAKQIVAAGEGLRGFDVHFESVSLETVPC